MRLSLKMNALAVLVCAAVNTANAGELSLRAELNAVVPIGEPVAANLFPGPGGQLTAIYSLLPWLSVMGEVGYFFLPSNGALREGSSGFSLGPAVRVQHPSREATLRPWAEVAVLFHRTGSLNRVAVSPGIGLNCRVDAPWPLWVGPQLRLLHVFSLGDVPGTRTADANLLAFLFGVEFDLFARPAPVVAAPVIPVAPPPPPDGDGDGVLDTNDRCPTTKGLATLRGCPDGDGDGIDDTVDRCPKEAEDRDGNFDDDGCPEVEDRDGDTVADADDRCPSVAGPAQNAGCPVVMEKNVRVEQTKIEILQKVLFDTGQVTIQPASFGLLDEVSRVLKTYERVCVRVEGHTDNQGDPPKNLELSKGRARSVSDYLTGQGIAASRLSAEGYGDTQPLKPNTTAEGRDANRRVVFSIIPCPKGAP